MLSHIRKNAIFESYEFSSLLKLGLLSAIQSQLSHKNCFLPNNSCKNQGFTFFLLFTFWFRERLILLLFLNYAQSPQKSCKNETSSQLFLFWTHNQDTIEVKFSRLENTQIYKYSRSFVGRCHLGVSKRYGKHFVSVSRVKVALFGERNKEGSTNGLRCSLPRNLQAGSANEKKNEVLQKYFSLTSPANKKRLFPHSFWWDFIADINEVSVPFQGVYYFRHFSLKALVPFDGISLRKRVELLLHKKTFFLEVLYADEIVEGCMVQFI